MVCVLSRRRCRRRCSDGVCVCVVQEEVQKEVCRKHLMLGQHLLEELEGRDVNFFGGETVRFKGNKVPALPVYLSVCLSVCLFVYLSVCLSVCLFVYLSVCLSVCLPVCLPV